MEYYLTKATYPQFEKHLGSLHDSIIKKWEFNPAMPTEAHIQIEAQDISAASPNWGILSLSLKSVKDMHFIYHDRWDVAVIFGITVLFTDQSVTIDFEENERFDLSPADLHKSALSTRDVASVITAKECLVQFSPYEKN